MAPNLDHWLARPGLRVTHRRESEATPQKLWDAAQSMRLGDAGRLGRLVRWRIPGTSPALTFEELFRRPPFMVLEEDDTALVSGLVGRIWTLRRDYPRLKDPEDFREWSKRGSARVVFAHWVEGGPDGGSVLTSEARVEAIGAQGRLGVRAVRPLVRAFQHLIASEGMEPAARQAEQE